MKKRGILLIILVLLVLALNSCEGISGNVIVENNLVSFDWNESWDLNGSFVRVSQGLNVYDAVSSELLIENIVLVNLEDYNLSNEVVYVDLVVNEDVVDSTFVNYLIVEVPEVIPLPENVTEELNETVNETEEIVNIPENITELNVTNETEEEIIIVEEEELGVFGTAAESVFSIFTGLTFNVLNGTLSNLVWNSGDYVEFSLDTEANTELLGSQTVGWVNMTDNIILYHFDNESASGENSTSVYDFSGNNNNATFNVSSGTMPTWVATGKINGSFDFNGLGDHMNLGDVDEMDSPTKFTVAMWFKRDTDLDNWTNHGIRNVLVAQSSPVSDDNFELGSDGSLIEFYLDTVSKDGSGSVDVALQNDSWNHVVFVYDANKSTEVKIYFNGYKVYENVQWGGYLDDSVANSLSLGAARPDMSLMRGFFNGSIDEFALWNRSLTAAEVLGIYNVQKGSYLGVGNYTSAVLDLSSDMIWQNFTWAGSGIYGSSLPDSQVVESDYNGANMTGNMLLLHMNESSGNIVDFSGNSYTSNLIGEVEYSSTETVFDGSIKFTEDKGYYDLGNDSSLNLDSEITMEGWFKPDSGEWGYGHLDSPIRSQYQFDGTDGKEPDIIQVYDDVYLVSYYGVSATGWMETLRIKNGYIEGVIDKWNHNPTLYYGRHNNLFNLSNNLTLLIYCSGNAQMLFKTINISSDGMFVGEVDSWTASIGDSEYMSAYYLGNSIYATVLSDSGSDGFIRTFNVSSNGSIVKSEIDNFEFNGTMALAPNMVQVNGTVYAIGYETTGNDGVVTTVEILDNGTITQSIIDEWEFAPSTGDDPHIFHVNGSIFGVSYRNSLGYVMTFEIQPNGSIIDTALNTVTLDPTAVIDMAVTNISETTFAFFYSGDGSDGLFETMEIQGNGSITDTSKELYEYDITAGSDQEIYYFDGIYYLAYQGEGGDGYVSTFGFNERAYAADAKGENWEFTANNDVKDPRIEHMRNNLFVVLHESPNEQVKLSSFQVQDNASIGSLLDEDTLTGGTYNSESKMVFKVSDEVVVTEFTRMSGSDGWLQTHQVLDNGTINQIDSLDIGDSLANAQIDYVQVEGDIYAIAYSGDGTDGFVKTLEIQKNGSVGSTFINSYEFDITISNANTISHIIDNYYGVFYRDTNLDGWVKTLEILDNGTITQSTIASYEFDMEEAENIDSVKLSDKHVAIVYHDEANDGQLMTLSFWDNGSVSGTDVYEFDTNTGEYPKIKRIVDDYYVIVYATTTGFNHKEAETFQISETGSIRYLNNYYLTAATDNHDEIDVAVGERGVIVASHKATGNDGFVASFKVLVDRGFVKPGSYGIDATQSKAYSVLNDSYLSTSLTNKDWNHIAMTYDGATQSLYVNGVLRESAAVNGIPVDYYNLSVGKYYTGYMDDLAIYNRSLTANEVAAHYARGAVDFNISLKTCDDAACDVEPWEQTVFKPGDLSLTNNRYIQFLIEVLDSNSNNDFEMNNITFAYDVANAAPTVDSANVTSSSSLNYSNGTLVGAWAQTDTDADPLTNQTKWWADGVENITFANFTSIEEANLTKGEVWNFSVRVHDGTVWSAWSDNASVTLVNFPALVTLLNITSSSSSNFTNGTLSSSWIYSDPIDSDSQSMNETKWFKDGVLNFTNITSVDSGNLSYNEVWNISVRTYDGTVWSAWSNNVSMVIGNSLPVVGNLTLNSSSASNYTNGTLYVSWIFSDADGHSQTMNETRWTKNGVLNHTNFTSITSGNLTAASIWNVSVRVYDGTSWSAWSENRTLTIVAIPAVTEEVAQFPSGSVSYNNDDEEEVGEVEEEEEVVEEDLDEEEEEEVETEVVVEEEEWEEEVPFFRGLVDDVTPMFNRLSGNYYLRYIFIPVLKMTVLGAPFMIYELVFSFL